MSPQLRGMHFKAPQQQRGAIGLMAALTLGMVLLFMLLVVDSGRLYLEQRKLQRVADMAALEAVTRGGSCSAGTATTYVNASATRNNFTPGGAQKISPTCGTLVTGTDNLRTFKDDASQSSAIRVIATTTVPTSVAGGLWNLLTKQGIDLDTQLTASAVGTIGGAPLAMLTIRSTLANIDSTKSPILNAFIGGLLGGSLNLSAVSWQGLVTTDINLLSYFNQLISLNPSIGSYDELLKTNIKFTQLLEAAVTVLKKNGAGADVAADALGAVIKLVALTNGSQVLKLGDLINIKNGTTNAGLDANLKVFNLLQGLVQLSNGKSAVSAHLTINPLNLVNIDVYTKVIQPPQLSAIGNPALIKNDYAGPNQISVRTAQVQTRIQIGLPLLNALQPLTDLLTSLVSTVAKIVGEVLQLNLIAAIECLGSCKSVASLSLLSEIDVYIEVASANSYVTDYSCVSETSKSLTAQANTALAKVSIGAPPKAGTFPPIDLTTNSLKIAPVNLININMKTCALAVLCSTGNGDGGSFNLKVQTDIAPAKKTLFFASPDLLGIKQATTYQSFGSNDNVLQISNASGSIITTSYTPPAGKTVTGSLLEAVSGLINTLTSSLVTVLNGILSSLVNPVLNTLLSALGVNVAVADIGANLSCNQGGRAQLVL